MTTPFPPEDTQPLQEPPPLGGLLHLTADAEVIPGDPQTDDEKDEAQA